MLTNTKADWTCDDSGSVKPQKVSCLVSDNKSLYSHVFFMAAPRPPCRQEIQHGGSSGRADAQTDFGSQRSEEVSGFFSWRQPAVRQHHLRLVT